MILSKAAFPVIVRRRYGLTAPDATQPVRYTCAWMYHTMLAAPYRLGTVTLSLDPYM